jgi:hypothetical protein
MTSRAGRLAVITGGLVLLGAPAYGLLAAPSPSPDEVRLSPVATEAPRPEPTTTAKPATVERAKPAEPTPERPKPEPRPDMEALELGCAAVRTDAGPAVACRWSASHSRAFAGYELWRAGPGDEPRTAVFRTRDRDATHFQDGPVRPGTYHYKVFAKNADGRIVGQSRIAEVRIGPKPDARVEPLKLECRGGTPDGQPVIGCRWSESHAPDFAGYRLIRQGPDGVRQVVFRTDDRALTNFADREVRPGATYHYKVVALGPDEKVVGESRVAEASTAGPEASGDATRR